MCKRTPQAWYSLVVKVIVVQINEYGTALYHLQLLSLVGLMYGSTWVGSMGIYRRWMATVRTGEGGIMVILTSNSLVLTQISWLANRKVDHDVPALWPVMLNKELLVLACGY